LEAQRRQDFRRARQVLLQARGQHTLCAEQHQEIDALGSNTIVQNGNHPGPVELDFWLMDKDFIYPLKIGLNTLGRSNDNDVVVQDSFISRRHCAILVHLGKGCELHDTASKNGTYLNGHKLSGPTRLNSGDQIRMCDRQFTFLTRGQTADYPVQAPTLSE
jgi:hypothetical protein